MALIVADRVQELSTTTGTGQYTLSGATVGFRAASTVCANGDTFTYHAEDVDAYGNLLGGWETGLGTWATGNLLTRTTIYASSNAGAAVNWAAGQRRISLSVLATDVSKYLKNNQATTTVGSGLTNQNIYLTIADPGVGYTNGFQFTHSTDGAGLEVTELLSDTTLYQFYMTDNPGTNDSFSWRYTDYQSANGLWEPYKITGWTNRFIGASTDFYSSIQQPLAGNYYTTQTNSHANAKGKLQQSINTIAEVKLVGSVALSTFDVSGYTGSDAALFNIKVTGTGTTFDWGYGVLSSFTPVQTGLTVSTSPQTLSNGIRVAFASTATALGDSYSARIWKNSSKYNTLITTRFTGNVDIGSTSAGKALTVYSTEGAELCPAITAGNWTLGTGWSISTGQLIKVAGTASSAYPTTPIVVTAGVTYKVVVTFSAVVAGANYLTYRIGNTYGSAAAVGTITDYLTAQTTGNLIFDDISTGESCTITAISVKAITTGDATIFGSLNVKSKTAFINPVSIGLGANQVAPLTIMTTGQEALRICRTNNTGQYIAINESDGLTHSMDMVGDKSMRFRNYSTTYGFDFYVNNGANRALAILPSERVLINEPTDDTTSFLQVNGTTSSTTFKSTATTGTAPLIVASTTLVSNLNADQLDGLDSTAFTRKDQTYLGSTTNVAIDSVTNTAALWSALPVGYARMMSSTIGTGGGLPVANHGYFLKIANRDVSGGWAGIFMDYTTGIIYAGKASDNTVLATWTRLWDATNDGAGSGLDADLLDGQQGAFYAPIASPTFTGTPAAPTATAGTNTTQIATTAFVTAAVAAGGGGNADPIAMAIALG